MEYINIETLPISNTYTSLLGLDPNSDLVQVSTSNIITDVENNTKAIGDIEGEINDINGKINEINKDIYTTNAIKQDTLESGVNIKTINGLSILGKGDLVVGTTSDLEERITAIEGDLEGLNNILESI